MVITAALIKDLREKSGAGMMDCKKALSENNGDLEVAMDWLRKKGLASAAKKSGRTTAEGLVGVSVAGNVGALIELNSETDFVARNEHFQKLAGEIAQIARNVSGIDALKAAAFPGTGRNVEEEIAAAIGTIGENMNLRRVSTVSVPEGVVASYVHNAAAPGLGKIGVLVGLKSVANPEKLQELGKQIAMHIAAAKPDALHRDQVDAEKLQREREVFKDQAIASGKAPEIAEKMVDGRIRKYYEEVVLLEQVFVMDGKTKVSEVIENAAKELGCPIELTAFTCFQLGDGIEKEETDFAAEVAAAAGAA